MYISVRHFDSVWFEKIKVLKYLSYRFGNLIDKLLNLLNVDRHA
jgi:hypothetical protein